MKATPLNGRELQWLFVPRLQEAMLEKNWTAADVAARTRIPISTISAWQRGESCPRLGDPRRKKVARAMGKTVGWINGVDEEATDHGGPEDRRE